MLSWHFPEKPQFRHRTDTIAQAIWTPHSDVAWWAFCVRKMRCMSYVDTLNSQGYVRPRSQDITKFLSTYELGQKFINPTYFLLWILQWLATWNFTFMLPCIVIDSFLNNEPDALIIQIYSVIKLYVFRESSLPIIRSFPLYIRHW
jgi:hypothetical protein